ncbi:MAG: DUF4230 domain-containing protein [Anaerolineales bacterium]|nr:DUF4230 domain-containing protein [Anaerolineales bacterium]
MKWKPDLNTVILLTILVVLVVGSVLFITALGRIVAPLERAERAIGEGISEIMRPTPTIIPDPISIIREVRSLSRLETAAYTVEKVITAETGQGPFAFLFGDRLILVAHGQVIAGVDLESLGPQDIAIAQDGTVLVILPPAEVLVTALSSEKSYVYDRDTGVIGMNAELETSARQAAETEILNVALDDGILDMAADNAKATLRQLILGLGYEEVLFVDATPSARASD